jgi:hypothetical protein
MSSDIPDMADLQEKKIWAVVHTAWLLIRKNVLNDIHCTVVRKLYQMFIQNTMWFSGTRLNVISLLLPSVNTAILDQFLRQTQIL